MSPKVAVRAEQEEGGGLRRELGIGGAASIIVGIVIGSGIFLGVNRVAAGAGSPWLVVLVWVLAGLLTLAGALTYAEFGSIFPKAGGEYVFLREGIGSFAGFMSGWTAFTVNLAGSTAALALIFAEQLDQLKPFGGGALSLLSIDMGFHTLELNGVRITAICLIGFLSIVNYFGLKYGAGVQRSFAVLKVVLIVLLAAAALLYIREPASPSVGFFEQALVPDTPAAEGFSLAGFLGLAMVGALFAYDGWTDLVRVGGEVKNPGRNIPRASLLAMLAIIVLYILISLGYMQVLGFEGFANGQAAGFDSERTVASNAAQQMFGAAGLTLVTIMILISVFGGLNGVILVTPRVLYAMGRDRLFPSRIGTVNRHHVPAWGILANGAMSVVFLLFFDFDALSGNVVFISFFFYGLAAIGLMVLRKTHPGLDREYRVPWYPWLPLAFIATSFLFVGYLIYEQVAGIVAGELVSIDNLNRLIALAIVALGVPVYFHYRHRIAKRFREEGGDPPPPLWGPPDRSTEEIERRGED